MSCHFQVIVPGETSCFSCIPPLALVENSESKVKREGVCAASLPTTMVGSNLIKGITAGFLAHTAMKMLLEYEEIALHLQYNAKKEFFSNSVYPPNPECKDHFCIKRQQEKIGKPGFLSQRKEHIQQKLKEAIKPIQENKEEVDKWGIEMIEEPEEQESQDKTHVIGKEETQEQSLDSLMDQLKNLSA